MPPVPPWPISAADAPNFTVHAAKAGVAYRDLGQCGGVSVCFDPRIIEDTGHCAIFQIHDDLVSKALAFLKP